MKNIKIALLSFFFAPALVFANGEHLTIPNPGTTPDSIFYIFDKLAENIQNLFTINPVAKAKLQLRLSAERIAEIGYLIEEKGIEAKEIESTQARLIAHLAKSNGIVEKQHDRGMNVVEFADELSEGTEVLEDATEEMFQKQIDEQMAKRNQMEANIEGMIEEGAAEEELAELERELEDINEKIEMFGMEKEKQLEIVSNGEIVFYKMIDDQRKAKKRIRGSESEKTRVSRSEGRTGISGPVENKSSADALLTQAKAEFDKGNFAESARLALFAKNEFVTLRERIDDTSKRAKNISRGRTAQQEKADNRLAQNRIKQADQQKANTIKIADRRGATLPQNVLKVGDDLLAKAKSEFEDKNDREAERFARGAKNIFIILRANIRALDKIGEDFEAEMERERIELEIRNRLDDNVFRGDINRRKAETKVTAEIIGNNALARVEVKFNSGNDNRTAVAQDILNRMKLSRDDISRLLVVQQRVEQEELRERLEAKVRARTITTEAEAKFRFPISIIGATPVPTVSPTPTTSPAPTATPRQTSSPTPAPIVSEQTRQRIIDAIFQRVSALRVEDILAVMEFRVDDDRIVIRAGEVKVRAEIIGNNALGKVEVKFGTTLQGRNEIAQEITRRMKLTRDEVSRLLVIEPMLVAEELRDRLEAKSRVRARGTEAEAKLRFPISLIGATPTLTPTPTVTPIPTVTPTVSESQRQRIIDAIFQRVSVLGVEDILAVMEFRVDGDVFPTTTPRPTTSPSPTATP